MVSLTFDEFHAIRSRQRAAAEIEAATAAGVAAAPSSRSTQRDPHPKDKPRESREPARASTAAILSSAKHSPRRSAASSSSSPRGALDNTEDEKIAPTSGSGFRKQPLQQEQLKKGNKPEMGSDFNSRWGGGQGMSTVASLGRFVELFEVQVAVIAMIYLDLVASTAQLLPFLQAVGGGGVEAEGGAGEGATEISGGAGFGMSLARLVSRLMQSFTGFTIIFFALEVLMLLAAFRGKFFRHLGYVLDLLVVSTCLYQELAGKSKGVRLLGALRVWRVARVMNTLLLSAEGAHEQTRDTLRVAEKSTRDVETDRRRLQETLRREVEARKRVDKMLRGYKDEVETLNEALKIAAMDIATAGVSPGMGIAGTEDRLPKRGLTPAGSDAGSSTGGSENAGSHELVDGSDDSRTPRQHGPSSSSGSAATGRSTANKIFVFQDGTFQAR